MFCKPLWILIHKLINLTPRDIEGKWLADMSKLATQRLNKLGVTQVFDSGLCTFQDKNDFYSYRRDGVTGRQATFIWIED